MKSGEIKALMAAAMLLAGIIAFLAIFARPAAAQTFCARIDQITAALAARYGEAPVSQGLTASAQRFVIFAAEDGATFTLIIESPGGVGCVAASGTDWQNLAPAPKGEPS